MDYKALADRYARQYGVDPNLFRALVAQESNWNPTARSPVGAYGLTQVMPDTARQPGLGVRPLVEVDNPEEQLRFGAEYFSQLLNRYGGDTRKALAAYNWGMDNADDWGGDVSALPAETRNYIANITSNASSVSPVLSTQGGAEDATANQSPISVSTLDADGNPTGITPTDALIRTARMGLMRDQEDEWFNSLPEPGQTDNPAGGPTDGPQMDPQTISQAAMDQSKGEAPERRGFLDWLMPALDEDQRRQALLAIGAGLLSGDDWNTGLAAASQGLLGLNQQWNADEQDLRLRQLSAAGRGFDRVGSVMTPDGQIVGGVSYDPMDGQFFTYDANGQRENIPGAIPLNNSDASGSRFATFAVNERDAASEAAGTLRSIDRALSDLDIVSYGIPGLVDTLQRTAKTMINMGLTEEEIAKAEAQGELQSLVGRFREDTVGPGVMTEQDAARVVIAMGGDLQSITSNPEITRERLNTLRKDVQRRYDRHYDQYQRYQTQFPYMPMDPLEYYTGPGILDQSNGGRQDSQQQGGGSYQPDPEVEEYLRSIGVN